MKKEIVFIDDDTLTPEELAMLLDEFGVEFVTEKTEEKDEQQTEKQE